MIVKKQADNITDAAYDVTMKLLKKGVPPRPVMIKPGIVKSSPPPTTTGRRVLLGIIDALIHMSGV